MTSALGFRIEGFEIQDFESRMVRAAGLGHRNDFTVALYIFGSKLSTTVTITLFKSLMALDPTTPLP